MKIFAKYILVILGVLIFHSCRVNEKKQFEETLNGYLVGLSVFDKSLKDHFPFEFDHNEIKDISFSFPNAVIKGGYAYAMLRINLEQTKFEKSYLSLKNQYNLLNRNDIIFIGDSISSQPKTSSVLLPDLSKLYDDILDIEELRENYEFYIIDTGIGDFVGSEKELAPRPKFPKEIQHGYSRGIGFNREDTEAIYWLFIW